MNIAIHYAEGEEEIGLFWDMFDKYIRELAKTATLGGPLDLEYFTSEEYKDAIMSLYYRDNNPLKIAFPEADGAAVGFMTYLTYLDEDGKCFILEYGICPERRGRGIGGRAYELIEARAVQEGAQFFELTPSDGRSENFWLRHGYIETSDFDDDNKAYYRKYIGR